MSSTAPHNAPFPTIALIGFGHVWHTRLRPRKHRFTVPTFFLLLPMRTLQAQPSAAGVLARNRWNALSFYDADHGNGQHNQDGSALAWLDALLQAEGIHDAKGEIWLQCYPRVLGYSFKPVSFWYCFTKEGELRAIVAEVNNTFNERHVYLLDKPQYDQTLTARKMFHVSPFCAVEGQYLFEFHSSGDNSPLCSRVQIAYHDDEGPVLLTGISGKLEALTPSSRRRALWRYPFMTLGVTARILWHALLLWLKGVPVHTKPKAAASSVSRSSSTDHSL